MSNETESSSSLPLRSAQFEGDALWVPSWKESNGEATIRLHHDEQPQATTSSAVAEVDFYCSWFCPFAQRAWIALEEHKVPYRYMEINPYQVDPTEEGGYTKKSLALDQKRALFPKFMEASPRGLVPALRHYSSTSMEKFVWESLQTVEYIDLVWGHNNESLVPRDDEDPHLRAMVRIWSDHCTDRIQKWYYTALMEQNAELQVKALHSFYEECRALARAMDPKGPYFLGKRFSLVDVALAPFWQRFVWVGGHYRNLSFPEDEPEFDRLRLWWKHTSQRPSVAATLVSKPRLIASYSQYSRNVATSDFAKSLKNSLSSTTTTTTKTN